MANETRGELAEAIAVVALERAVRRPIRVYWEERPSGALVVPDITLGVTASTPSHVVLVTACDTPRSSAMKYWRDLGEVFDSKSSISSPPRVMSLVFRSFIKEELIRLESALCDSVILVDRDELFGGAITAWLESNHADAPSNKDRKKELVQAALLARSRTRDDSFATAMEHFVRSLRASLDEHKAFLAPLWEMCREDTQAFRCRSVREPKNTLFRRGVGRWVVIDPATRQSVFEAVVRRRPIPPSIISGYEVELGMVSKRLTGYALRDNGGAQDMVATVGVDLAVGAQFFIDAARGETDRAVAGFRASMADVPEYMSTVAAQLRAAPGAVRGWHEFTKAAWPQVIEPWSLYQLMRECDRDETMGSRVTVPSTGRIWLYDHCVALLRAATGRNNDFGYGPLGTFFQQRKSTRQFVAFIERVIGDLPEGVRASARRWVDTTLARSSEPGRRGFQDWLARTKRINNVIIAAYSYSLALTLREVVGESCAVALDKAVAAHAYALWNKLLTYPDFEGLPGLVLAACGDKARWITVPTLMAEIAGETVQEAGVLRVLQFRGGLIFWVSATDAGRGHKVKELSAKARCLRYQLSSGRFSRRPTADRLLLVVDGTFSRLDLEALRNAGWDEFFYPDEMDRLRDAIA